ncbi:unnamed protein product [Bemisia tabaci]|uniref:Lachesin n=1 Tax=Bemisia tabaci TaxID=7038 RepID=A0A9P0EVP5_BEMTA|nr:unnamed protein product [Bemisia tabaci]
MKIRPPATVENFSGEALTLVRADRRQMGAYLCIASNDVPPAVSKRITLYVTFAPVIKVPNQLLGAPLNTDVTLECNVEAFPNTVNYWVRDNTEMLLEGTTDNLGKKSGDKNLAQNWRALCTESDLVVGTEGTRQGGW